MEDVLVGPAGHTSITRDPSIRELVVRTIEELEGFEPGRRDLVKLAGLNGGSAAVDTP